MICDVSTSICQDTPTQPEDARLCPDGSLREAQTAPAAAVILCVQAKGLSRIHTLPLAVLEEEHSPAGNHILLYKLGPVQVP